MLQSDIGLYIIGAAVKRSQKAELIIAYDRQQVIYIFDKMRVKVNTQKLHVKNVKHRDSRQTDDIILGNWRTPGLQTVH